MLHPTRGTTKYSDRAQELRRRGGKDKKLGHFVPDLAHGDVGHKLVHSHLVVLSGKRVSSLVNRTRERKESICSHRVNEIPPKLGTRQGFFLVCRLIFCYAFA